MCSESREQSQRRITLRSASVNQFSVFALCSLVLSLQTVESTDGFLTKLNYCEGANVRSLTALASLRECDVIEGDFILSFKIANSPDDWETYGRLRVTEITGFVIFFLVDNLPSLELVLPHLRVIRGNSLFSNYALVVNSLNDLKTIGLPNLTSIIRGSVNIKNNPALTPYVHAVNWDRITLWNDPSDLTHKNYIQPVNAEKISCPENCTYCWSARHCQKVCPEGVSALSCSDAGKPCSKGCVGGCFERNGWSHCHVCEKFKISGKCGDSCDHKIEYENYRCIDERECKGDMGRKILKRKCVKDCPPFYKEVVDSNTRTKKCSSCLDCEKTCKGGRIESVEDAQRLSGCTKITGSLQIRAFGSNLMAELVKHLSHIKEVDDFVYVFKSKELQSLRFLSSLETIHGKELWNNNYSLVVHENDNLKALWNTSSKFLNIVKGKVLFYQNPKLCWQNIVALVGEEVWNNSVPNPIFRTILNGNENACSVRDFKYRLQPLRAKGELRISFKTDQFDNDFKRYRLYGFFVYYRQGQDGEGVYDADRQWFSTFRRYENLSSNDFEIVLGNLTPFTNYSVYLETHTTNPMDNFKSSIKHARTKPFNPSVLQEDDIKVSNRGNDKIEITLNPPMFPNGIIDHYMVVREEEETDYNFDICNLSKEQKENMKGVNWNKFINKASLPSSVDRNVTLSTSITKTCSCPSQEAEIAGENKRESINLARNLARLLYRMSPTKRSRRDVEAISLLESHCGKPSTYESGGIVMRSNKLGGLTKILEYPSEEKAHFYHGSHLENDEEHERIKLISKLTKEISVEWLIPYIPNAYQNENCSSYLLRVLKPPEIIEPTHQNVWKSEESGYWLSEEPQYVTSDNEVTIRYGQKYYIENLTSASYRIKVKACQAPISSTKECGSSRTCKLCSVDYGTKIVHATVNEDLLQVENIQIDVSDGSVHVMWDPPPYRYGSILGYFISVFRLKENSKLKRDIEYYECRNSTDIEVKFNITIPGRYSVNVSAFWKDFGWFPNSSQDTFTIDEIYPASGNGTKYILYTLAIVFFSFVICFYIYMKSNGKDIIIDEIQSTINSKYMNGEFYCPWMDHLNSKIHMYYIHSPKNLQILNSIDEGKFGTVWKGVLKLQNGCIDVAVKRPKSSSDSEILCQLIDEASLMIQFRSYHVVQTYGVVCSNQEICIVMEYMLHGSLKKYLYDRTKENVKSIFSVQQILKLSIQIADGMNYLSHKKILHMDLAARNCLLDANFNVKVSDFGMSREVDSSYYRIGHFKLIPLRWMPPEYFIEQKFMDKSDVWSYGILLWEIFNPGKHPYPHLEAKAIQNEVKAGQTLSATIPTWLPHEFVALINSCWGLTPAERPTFRTIVEKLLLLIDNDFRVQFQENSFYFCGESDIGPKVVALPLEGDTSSISVSMNNDDDVTPSTPLTTPASSANTLPAAHSLSSRPRREEPKSLRERISLSRWRRQFSTIKNSFSLSTTFPFLSVQMNSLSESQKNNEDIHKNNLPKSPTIRST